MKPPRPALLMILACAAGAVPAASQQQPTAPMPGQSMRWAEPHPNADRGRLVAIGGEVGHEGPRCSACHGLDGAANRSGAFPRLAGQSGWYLYSELRDFASGARPSEVMAPIARQLTHAEMQDVAAYFASLGNPPYPPPLERDEALIAEGRKIAVSGLPAVPACESCHGGNGIGDPPLFPFLAGQFRPYLEHQLMMFKSGKRGGDPMNVMQAIAGKLNLRQIKAVAAYFSSLTPEKVAPGQARLGEEGRGPAGEPLHMGATTDPRPGEAEVVVPGAPGAGETSGR